ncbi:MAG: 4-hydroxy-tetrahydrodipicolinate reductase [Synergistaceae bacterium]|nr:4-hydroxy-tetrahydrodipicolinate reductase [Synergistaceae bacterium]
MKYGIVGASGRMGREIALVFGAEGHELVLTADVAGTECRGRPEVILDFSSPAALVGTLALRSEHGCALVVGTTALRGDQLDALRTIPAAVVQSFNFATGVNILKMVLRDYAPMLSGWDAEFVEAHHNKKKDAPSGTAILLRDAAGRGGAPIHSLRLGGVPGDHEVLFAGEGEVLTFGHRAISRSVFAWGAHLAAKFAVRAPNGFYSFEDVLRNKT